LSQPIPFLRYENSLFLVSVFLVSAVVDRHPKSIFKNKKIINLDPSPPGPDPGIEDGGCHRPHKEGGGAIGHRCRSRSHRRGLLSARSKPATAISRLEPHLGGAGVLAAIVEGVAPCLSTATAAHIRRCRTSMSAHHGGRPSWLRGGSES
jgi:hypothetical protein